MNGGDTNVVEWSKDQNKENLRSFIARGLSIPEIAKAFGISQRATYTAVYRHTEGLRRARHKSNLPMVIR